jgi:hypothetical protein
MKAVAVKKKDPNHNYNNNKDNDGSKFGIFALTTIINSSTSMMKDKFYATYFGSTS